MQLDSSMTILSYSCFQNWLAPLHLEGRQYKGAQRQMLHCTRLLLPFKNWARTQSLGKCLEETSAAVKAWRIERERMIERWRESKGERKR